jgi:hypothetical protein
MKIEKKNTNDMSSWDQDFLKVDQGTLFELILVGIFHFYSFRKKNIRFSFSGCKLFRYQRFT